MEFKFLWLNEEPEKLFVKITVKKKRELFLGFSLVVSRFFYVAIFCKNIQELVKEY